MRKSSKMDIVTDKNLKEIKKTPIDLILRKKLLHYILESKV